MIIPRAAQQRLQNFASAFRVVIVNGPRQAGKTTLLRLHQAGNDGEYRTLDDAEVLRSALQDPVTFVREAVRPLCIDEVQRGGDTLVRAIKVVVDEDWRPGQFLLSGSSRFLTVPTLSESLAGRAGLIDLWPLSMVERAHAGMNFVDLVFNEPDQVRGRTSTWSRNDLLDAIVAGGYPEVLRIPVGPVRDNWYESYLSTIIQRDVREFTRVQDATGMERLLMLVASRSGSTLVHSDLARALGNLSPGTVRTYLSYLETVFLIGYAPAWSTNLTSKVAKTPKAYLTDAGLAAHLVRVSADGLRPPGHPALGGLTETFVFNELTKSVSLASTPTAIHHFRDRDGREIDFILEARDGRVVAIEVKASVSPPRNGTRHLEWLRDKLGERFVAGIMLYFGEHTLPHGDRIIAAPLSALWGHADLPQ